MHRQSCNYLYELVVIGKSKRTFCKIPSILYIITRKIKTIRPGLEYNKIDVKLDSKRSKIKYMEQLLKSNERV
jgi:hypothetical protein